MECAPLRMPLTMYRGKQHNAKIWRPDLESLERQMSLRIKGQPENLSRLSATIIRRETEAIPQRGPRGKFFFAGPTGTGKTFTAHSIAELLFGSGHFIVFDCSEFKTLESVATLLGDRSGDDGRFGAAYARVPAGCWLFDEIEKAHKEFVDLFLQMVGDSRVTLASGRTIDLCGIYIFVTSNLGSARILGRDHLPFASIERHVIHHVQKHLRPELLGRFGRPYVFHPLSREAQTEIAEERLAQLMEWEQDHGRTITCDQAVVTFLVQRGFSSRFGARPLLETIEEFVGNAVARNLLSGGSGSGQLVVNEGQLSLVP
jgi:ATP-dependent Clp protease ATP-binding subunit ClpA